MRLSESQHKAVHISSGNLLILAGPGTGKTRVLVQKMEQLLKSDHPAESILALTFSRKAAEEMKERLSHLPLDQVSCLGISTFHAWCVDFIQTHGFRLGYATNAKIITQSQSRLVLRELLPRLPVEKLIQGSQYESLVGPLLSLFQELKDEGVWPEDLLSLAAKLPDESDEEKLVKEEWTALGDCYLGFQSECFQKGYYDFGDAILGSLRILETFPQIQSEVRSQLKAILVDEFQDTNWTQIKFLRAIAHPEAHVAVVGDDDQSIYRFRGASYSAFQFFEEAFPNTQVVELTESYRLPVAVVDAASALIKANGENRFRPDKMLVSKSNESSRVCFVKPHSPQQEAQWLASEIKNLVDSGVPPAEIAVLYRSHGHGSLFLEEAARIGLPVYTRSKKGLFEDDLLKDVFALFRLINEPRDSISMARLLDSVFVGLSCEEIFEFSTQAKSRGWNLFNAAKSAAELDVSENSRSKLAHFVEIFTEVYSYAQRLPTSLLVGLLIQKFELFQKLRETHLPSLRKLGVFCENLRSWEDVQSLPDFGSNFSALQSYFLMNEEFGDSEEEEVPDDQIRALSIHASKGLEFEHVFLIGLTGRRIPSPFKGAAFPIPEALRKEAAPTKASHIEEERRLIYVAMTRAKKELVLTSVDTKGTKPSKFVTENIIGGLKPQSLKEVSLEPPEELKALKPGAPLALSRVATGSELPRRKRSELRLSFTQLDKYEWCPQAYWFACELQLPPAPSPALSLGSIVHESLEHLYREFSKGQLLTEEEFIQFFEGLYHKESEKNPLLHEKHLDQNRQKLLDYYRLHEGQMTKPLFIEKAFKIQIGPHVITGKIDRIDEADDGSIRIIDYKTGRSKSAEKEKDRKFADESLQFSIYALAAERSLNLKVREMLFYYIDDNTTLTTTRSEEALQKAESRVSELASKIFDGSFAPTPNQKTCSHCEYRSICPASAA